MESKLEKAISIGLSMCDNTGRMAIPHIFSLFMDLAAEHGDSIGVGMNTLSQKGLFWLTVKTKVRIYHRPALLDTVTAENPLFALENNVLAPHVSALSFETNYNGGIICAQSIVQVHEGGKPLYSLW